MPTGEYTEKLPPQLPPADVIRFIIGKDKPLLTPVDSYGLVVQEKLIAAVKSTVDPAFDDWETSEDRGSHHLYWPRNSYLKQSGREVDLFGFRNSPSNRIMLPRTLHNLLHIVTEPPPIPNEEVVRYHLKAQRVVNIMYSSALQSKRLIELTREGNDSTRNGINYHYNRFCQALDEAKTTIPPGIYPLDFSELNPSSAEDVYTLVPRIGRVAVRGSIWPSI